MTGLAVAMDVVAAGFFAWFLVLVTRKRGVPAGEGGRSVAMVLIAVSLGLLSVSLWSLP
ncbi:MULTISPECIES: hypothetical protein [Actinomadura]|uniref:Uncharacterized protein n=1 Tax=Actinomadura madurae TaxID=1993 RepID=A0A1I4Z2Z2_9ACTN|nr:hypothetical protein [Actinomadura madurae]URN05618.1 hypothetical protein LUW74_21410 [Actinomadura madurae]SFN44622.1 hypothetical protein SAMN04489713_10230 [Actinomadura madurae]SPT49662.1 Uncharacterised protein [Actinomadura madurae]